MIGEVFCECLGGFAACGLLRKKLANHLSFPNQNECHGVVVN